MTSSTTTRLAANPMQIHHCAKLMDVMIRIRCRNPIEVAAMIASSATPYRRSCVDPGTASRSKIVFRCSRASSPAARWNRDIVVSSIVDATNRGAHAGNVNAGKTVVAN